MIDVIMEHGYFLDKVVHAQIMATPHISADLPPMEEFKAKADEILFHRYGIVVEHVRTKKSFEEQFYTVKGERAKPKNRGKIYGFPAISGSWCVGILKQSALKKASKGFAKEYIGYAVNEKNKKRQEKINDYREYGHSSFIYPLVDLEITEEECFDWCKKNELLSPIYYSNTRGGCWFCPKQPLGQLKLLRKEYPALWQKLLDWDKDNPWGDFNIRYTVGGLEERFYEEDCKIITSE